MKGNTFLFNIIILFSLIFLSTGQLYSQETAPEDSSDSSPIGAESEDPAEETKKYPLPLEEGEEAPEHIFDMDLGGVGADVFWEGYWRFSMTYGTGFENGEDGFVFPSAFPGLKEGFEFAQEPDFFLSVLLLDHYFIETSFTEGYDKNTYAMGYVGDETTALKEVRIGNAGIGIGEFEGIDVSSPKYNTPGVKARFETRSSEHELMIRYDPTELQEKIYVGEYEVEEETLELPSFVEGQRFILPNENISDLVVYQEDSDGELTGSDGRRYTNRNISYSADLTKGFVNLVEASEGRVLIYYRVGGSPVGSDSISEDFIMAADSRGRPDPTRALLPFAWDEANPYDQNGGDFRDSALVEINGNEALMVYNPGEFSSFQMYNRYQFYTNLPDEKWRTLIFLVDSSKLVDEDQNYIYLTDTDENDNRTLTVLIENTDSRDPINRIPFSPENPEVYGPGRETDGDKISRELLLAVKKDSNNYYIGTNLIVGSVKVYVNGVEDKSVEVNYETGEIFFSRYIFPEDRIIVTYRTETVGLGGGDLFMAQGNRLFINENTTVELAEALRWTLPENQMTEEAGESPGLVELAGTMFYESENLNAMVNGSINISTSDTSGNLRLMGMEKSGYTFSVTDDQTVTSELDLTPFLGYPAASNRAKLLYRNFESTNAGGQDYLNDYTWGGASIDSSREGPSIAAAAANDPFSSRVMALTYDLSGGEWSAGDYLPDENGPIDFSGYTTLSFYLYRQHLGTDNLELELRIGDNGEAEDINENGSIDKGDSRFLLVEDLTSEIPASQGTWEKVEIKLSESDRQKLSRVRSLRFVLTSPSGSSSGDLLVGGITGEGSPLTISVTDSGGFERDADDINVVELEEYDLALSFPEVMSIFHPEGEDQKVLKLSWGNDSGGDPLDAGDTISGKSWFNAVPVTDYAEMAVYVKNETTIGEGSFSMTDSQGRGIQVKYNPGSTNWEKLVVDLQEGTASFSGSSTVSSLSIDQETTEFTTFSLTRSGVGSGTMIVDELHFAEPNFSTGSTIETFVDYKKPGIIAATSGGFPLLADFNVSSRFNYYGQTTDSYFVRNANRIESQLSSGVDLMNVRMQGDFEVVWSGGEAYLAGGHLFRIPSKSRFGWVSDSYSRSFQPGNDYMTRENVIHLTPFRFIALEVDSSSNASLEEITQGWGGFINLNTGPNSSTSIDADLYQSSDWESDSGNYFNEWSNDFKYIIPLEDGISSREGLSSLKTQRNPLPLGFSLETRMEYEALQQLDWQQENRWYSDISFPLEIANPTTPWTIKPGYRRELTQKVFPETYDDFADDLSTLFNVLGSQFPLTHFIPFYEIFGKQNLDDFEDTLGLTDESTYKPEVYMEINRLSGSNIRDLFIPSGVDVGIQREYYKKQDSVYIQHDWNFQLLQSAINLFGDWGQYPLFKFYATDEWSSSIQFIMGGSDLWTPEAEELVYQNYLTLAGEKDWEFVLDNRFTRKWEEEYFQDDFQMIFRWFEPENPFFKFPFFDYLVMKPNRMEHEEKLIFTGYFDESDSTKTSFDTILRHESKLVITGLGSLKGWMALGLGGKKEVFRNGYELGLELEMNF
ncbi:MULTISPECIES: hypothetical protein [unclassified Oceanispirochaeta]|uniref:hypothetical protein n=1 Tax=unclassified Oceanispirochaeta TaxID=2635722 RepID=UPI000E09D244|nr:MULTISPECIES: hypothetical protein [unclassified Oceanispirochaeta]MBF9018314.1 hypothetical protein [Oceanispirochaeta sp. M2]NPD74779.1 hypothetical protein [Oceanispirochaeta sp. M1]RDG29391.1 hypothetical protein DV872_22000 [Oceanispirochaeta sp. M1]